MGNLRLLILSFLIPTLTACSSPVFHKEIHIEASNNNLDINLLCNISLPYSLMGSTSVTKVKEQPDVEVKDLFVGVFFSIKVIEKRSKDGLAINAIVENIERIEVGF